MPNHQSPTTNSSLHPTLQRLDALADYVSGDPAVLAVLGLGSAGHEHERFDEHSDIDFFLVVADADAKQRYIDSADWLAGFGGLVVFEFVNDPNGSKALFEDGLFLEYAIFTPDELLALPFTGERIVWSRPGFEILDRPAPPVPTIDTVEFHLNEALTNLFVGLHRELRGEHLTAMRFIQVFAIDRVLALRRLDPEVIRRLPDPFEPTRRVERQEATTTLPLDAMIPGLTRNADAAEAVLMWLEEHHDPRPPIVSAIRTLITRCRSRH